MDPQDSGGETKRKKNSVKRKSEKSPVASCRKKRRKDANVQDTPSSRTAMTSTPDIQDTSSNRTAMTSAQNVQDTSSSRTTVTFTPDVQGTSSSKTAVTSAPDVQDTLLSRTAVTSTSDVQDTTSSRKAVTSSQDVQDTLLSRTAVTSTSDVQDTSSSRTAMTSAPDVQDTSSSRTVMTSAPHVQDTLSGRTAIASASEVQNLSSIRTSMSPVPVVQDTSSSRTVVMSTPNVQDTSPNKTAMISTPIVQDTPPSKKAVTSTPDILSRSSNRTSMTSTPDVQCISSSRTRTAIHTTLPDDDTQRSDSDSDVDEPHGMIRPSLLKQLQVILDEYPDDAQIIRELVQNAEDAGASEMRIFHDQRRTPLPDNNEFAKYFRAPALCIYNNETFRQQDWDGIITVYDSNKQKDALKVGRFGLGFKSVFHMTDHPVIISDNRLLIIDPCKEENECIPKRFKTIAKEASVKYALEPVFGMFGFTPECIRQKRYNGTLFWFSLREQGSALSDNLYSCEKMQTLLKSFEKESTMTLLFLRNMKKIFIHTENAEPTGPSLLVEHSLNSKYTDSLQNFHKCIRDNVRTQNENCVFRSSMIITKNDEVISTEKWAIVNLFKGSENMSNELKSLTEDKSLSYCPLVSIAVLTSPSINTLSDKPWLGHVFCFLPLPSENESLTGLPVHLNGFFALSQNRRHVKWPSSKNEDHSDKATQWNRLLCEEVLVDAYVEMFELLKEITIEDSCVDPSQNLVYKALPNISLVHCHWSVMLDPLYDVIFAKDIFYTQNDGGKWIPISEAIFSVFEWTPPKQNRDIEESVLDILILCKKNIVHLPGHLREALLKYCPNCKKISPGFVRKILKLDECYKVQSEVQKLRLLEFVISDLESNSEELENLELLPLLDGSFAAFNSENKTETIYISSESKEHIFFPKLEHRFANADVEQDWGRKIKDFATEGLYQLKCFEAELFPVFFKETLRYNGNVDANSVYYSPVSGNVSLSLLSRIWEYLNQKNESLSDLETLHIIPVQHTDGLKLLRLKGFYVLKSADGMTTLPAAVQQALAALSVTVIDSIPSTIHHQKLRGMYCKFPTAKNVIDLLQKMHILRDFSKNPGGLKDLKDNFNAVCSNNAKKEFTKYLAEESGSIPTEAKEILKELELFGQSRNDQMEDTLVSVSRNKFIACKEAYPYPFPIPYLIFDTMTSQLARRLDAEQLSWKDIIIKTLQCISHDDQSNCPYSGKVTYDFMEYFVHRLSKFEDESTDEEFSKALQMAKQIKFVTSSSGRMFKPDELFDPNNGCLRDLFTVVPDSFPCEKFSKPLALIGLKRLGLKSEADVSVSDMIQIAKNIHISPFKTSKGDEMFKSAEELLKFLQKNPKTLMETSLISSLKSLCWVPFVIKRPSNYPVFMPWCGSEISERLCSPEQCCTFEFMAIAGSSLRFIHVDNNSIIANAFGWNKSPKIDLVVNQLKVVIEVYQKDTEIDLEILKSIYMHFMECDINRLKDLLENIPYVFHRNGFCFPSNVYIDFPDEVDAFDLSPFMYRLPDEFNKMRDVFVALGCFEQLNIENLVNILQSICQNHQEILAQKKVDKDRKLAISILQTISNIVTDNYMLSTVLVPVAAEPHRLVMRPARECTYDDMPQTNDTIFLEEEENEDFKADIYVHPDVSPKLAESLGIPSLTERFMSDNDATEMMVDWGQSEPLTVRLSNLLESYGDGFSVLKELIQNAEDAGASEVRFMYDERQNDHLKTKVIENMEECQGPAFWAFNNAMFEEKDFENIIKLGGRTKETDRYKIGKFGLGFCSVYNLTDVPSFISGNTLIILDPHTFYLGKAISKKDNPGIRINFKNHAILKRYKNQFEPYNKVFGCTLSKENFPPNFNGSLFRFPLRTKSQAIKSDIKKLHYSHNEMVNLMKKFESSVGNLLMFTQKLQKVELWHLNEGAADPSTANLILRTSKSVLQAIPFEIGTSSAITEAGNIMDNAKPNTCKEYRKVEKISIEITVVPNKLLSKTSDKILKTETQWLVSWSSGSNNAVQKALSLKEKGALSLGSVALPLCENGSAEMDVLNLPNTYYKESHVFCFLPLPEVCSTPVHINGCFAVENDRKRICRASGDDKSTEDSDWNTVLLSDAVCNAYIHLMEYLNNDCNKHSEIYSELWPKYNKAKYDIQELTEAFYLKLIKSNPCVFHNGVNTSQFENCLFLESSLRHNENVGRIAYEALLKFYDGDKIVMDMTEEIINQFKQVGCQEYLEDNTLSVIDFYRTIIFPNLEKIHDNERNALVLFALDQHETLGELLEDTCCIPTSQNVLSLQRPRDLVKPDSTISKLFNEEDGRFPTEPFRNEKVFDILTELGMMHNELPPPLILERVNSVAELHTDYEKTKRCKNLLKYIQSKLGLDAILGQISSIPFLPVLRKPEYWPLYWNGIQQGPETPLQLDAPKNLYLEDVKDLIGSVRNVVDVRHLGKAKQNILKKLGVGDKSNINFEDVVQQLQCVADISDNVKDLISEQVQQLRIITSNIYVFFEEKLKSSVLHCNQLRDLQTKGILFWRNKLIRPDKTTFDKTYILNLSFNYEPEIYIMDFEFKNKYETFLKHVGVPSQLDKKNIMDIYDRVQDKCGNQMLTDQQVNLVSNLLRLLSDCIKVSQGKLTEDEKGRILVPDDQSRLRKHRDLCIDDGYTRLQKQDYMHFVNENIPPVVQKFLGIRSKRQQHLHKISCSMPFGQKEELVTRIGNILRDYPSQEAILKEMLQNADDAGASEINFILDLCQHDKKNIFDKSWEKLQGPALCVFNDSCFSEEDLSGITKLGTGSKSQDPSKTGQFGIGFNAVYHVTDAPSFITRGEATRNGGTYCVFDPHCKFCPTATDDQPGMRIEHLEDLKENYPDVYHCYLQDVIHRNQGTWFRFPLRTVDIAKDSKLSSEPTTEADVDNMFKHFKDSMLKCLLFLRNVRMITLSRIGPNSKGKLETIYKVQAETTKEDRTKMGQFFKQCDELSSSLKNNKKTLDCLPIYDVSYNIVLQDSRRKEESWLVVQNYGHSSSLDIPVQLSDILSKREIGLSPRGGVALRVYENLIDHNIEKTANTMKLKAEETYIYSENGDSDYAFCLLPLSSVRTGFPLCINGHFALDPARQYLKTDDKFVTPQGLWNKFLTENIISDAYVKLLEKLKEYMFEKCPDVCIQNLKTKDDVRRHKLLHFSAAFPLFEKAKDPTWKNLVTCVYYTILQKESKLFPIIVENSIKWVALQSQGHKFPAFFNDLKSNFETSWGYLYSEQMVKSQQKIKEEEKEVERKAENATRTLKTLGMKLIDFPICHLENILASLQNNKTDCNEDVAAKYIKNIRKVTEKDILKFLLSEMTEYPDRCFVKNLGKSIEMTSFNCNDNVKILIELCLLREKKLFASELRKLPLLVTNDGKLHRFEDMYPLYISLYCNLLPSSKANFVHRTFVGVLQRLERHDVLKPLNLSDFVDMLPQSVDRSHLCNNESLIWDKADNLLPTQHWIQQFWEFVDLQNIMDTSVILHALGDWCFVPCNDQISKQRKLVRLNLSYTVMFWMSFSKNDERQAFKSLRLPIPLESGSTLENLVAGSKSPERVIECLFFHKQSLKLVDVFTSKCILTYINSHLPLSGRYKSMLNSLPLYETVIGKITALDKSVNIRIINESNCQVLVKEGLDTWVSCSNYILLKNNLHLCKLFKFLGLRTVTTAEFYEVDLLPKFSLLCQECHLKHLEYIRDNKHFQSENFVKILKVTAFIPNENRLECARHYFNPNVHLFKLMCKPSQFPPEPYNRSEWLNFMVSAGMQNKISASLYVYFAKDLERCLIENKITEDLELKSKSMVMHVFDRKDIFCETLLDDICGIHFLISHHISEELLIVSSQSPVQRPVSFSESVSCSFERLVWTTMPLLPCYADPTWAVPLKESNKIKTFQTKLNISVTPPLKKVISHIHNVCHSLKKTFEKSKLGSKDSRISDDLLTNLMTEFYTYLKENGICEEAKIGLSETPLVHIKLDNDLGYFVKPNQITLDLQPKDEIQPYLFKLPMKYGAYCDLFKFYGATAKPNLCQYANVLECLYEAQLETSGCLAPNEKKNAKTAFHCLVTLLTDRNKKEVVVDLENLTVLYLLSEDEKIVKSSDVIVPDDKSLKRRLINQNLMFLLTKNTNAFKKLPDKLKPQFLTDIVEETLVSSKKDSVPENKFSRMVQSLLQSKDFLRGVDRYAMINAKTTRNEVGKISDVFKVLRVLCLNHIVTVLKINGTEVQESRERVACYYSKERKIIFLHTNYSDIRDFLKKVKVPICMTLCTLIQQKLDQLQMEKLFDYIDDLAGLKVFVDELANEAENEGDDENEGYPEIGSYVPKALHILLDNNFSDLPDGECVAHELWDPEIDGEEGGKDAIYIYVKVLHKVLGPSTDILHQKYLVDMGSNTEMIVHAVTLYVFNRKERMSCTDLVLYTDGHEGTTRLNKDCIFLQIQKTLKDAWKQNEKVKKRIVKRLLLRWHPDKNIGNEEFCTEVTQYILEVIGELENENVNVGTGTTFGAGSNRAYRRNWFSFAEKMRSRGSTHYQYFRQYNHYRTSSSDRPHIPNPQPFEAKRWMQQAKHDFKSAKITMNSANEEKVPVYNWVCVQCHQACEKACKAVGISIDTDKVNKRTHCLTQVNNCVAVTLTDSITEAIGRMEALVGSYSRMRYPGSADFPKIPSQLYTEENAKEAIELASLIIEDLSDML